MGSKINVFLGIVLVVILPISSEAFARELEETSSTTESSNEAGVGTDQFGFGGYPGGGFRRGGGYPGGGFGGYPGGGFGGYPGRGGGYPGGGFGGYPGRGGGYPGGGFGGYPGGGGYPGWGGGYPGGGYRGGYP